MASQAGRIAAPPADPRLVMPANISAQAQSRFPAYARAARPTLSRSGPALTELIGRGASITRWWWHLVGGPSATVPPG